MSTTDLDVVKAFYSTLLTSPADASAEKLYAVFSKPGAEGIFKTLRYFAQVVPDLRWEPDEILQEGNRYTVRSTFTGTPVGPFLGVEPATGKGFEATSIDILTVEGGRVTQTYHMEDWTSVIAQLTEQ